MNDDVSTVWISQSLQNIKLWDLLSSLNSPPDGIKRPCRAVQSTLALCLSQPRCETIEPCMKPKRLFMERRWQQMCGSECGARNKIKQTSSRQLPHKKSWVVLVGSGSCFFFEEWNELYVFFHNDSCFMDLHCLDLPICAAADSISIDLDSFFWNSGGYTFLVLRRPTSGVALVGFGNVAAHQIRSSAQ